MDDYGRAGAGVSGPGEDSLLERNLVALSRGQRHLADTLRLTEPHPHAEFIETPEEALGLRVVPPQIPTFDDPLGLGITLDDDLGSKPVTLASRRRPLTEASRLAETVDPSSSAAVCVLGFAAGHHVRALLDRLGEMGVVLAFEPDLSLLRSVLERIDYTDLLGTARLRIVTEPDDPGDLMRAVAGSEPVIAMGLKIVAHPASEPRLGSGAESLGSRLVEAVRATRTTVLTTMVQAETTLRNALLNIDDYITRPGIDELAGIAQGHPAIVVSAGPSLARTLDLLADPSVRDRFVIVAVQTVLKTLLRRGIKPHFVCALDHHEISKRFYEGLTAEYVEGVTLIAEPKSNPAILEAFPGRVRVVRDEWLDHVLGKELVRPVGELESGATVSHLCYYVARHLGCDPVVLVGQDLGFTDGLYYGPGAAIHEVWAGELGPFRTLEMFEWERVARGKSLLRQRTDVRGHAIYTDEQMSTYLSQFEHAFALDTARGLAVIDATGGGVAKEGAISEDLASVLARYTAVLPEFPNTPERIGDAADRRARTRVRLEEIERSSTDVARISTETADILTQMKELVGDHGPVNALIEQAYAKRDEVRGLEPAYGLAQLINQTGALNRFREDRRINIEAAGDELERQRRQIERDIVNVRWLGEAAGAVERLATSARGTVGGGKRETGDVVVMPGQERSIEGVCPGSAVVIFADPEVSGLGIARDLGAEVTGGENALRLTVRRALDARRAERVVVAATDRARVRRLLGAIGDDPRVVIESCSRDAFVGRAKAMGASRLWAPEAWRGGIGGASVYDEGVEPRALLAVMDRLGLASAVLIGPDWPLVDPVILDQLIERWHEHPDGHKVAICQAVPGLGGLLIDRATAETLADAATPGNPFCTIGAMLSYLPQAPQADPIAKSFCLRVPAIVRDAGVRVTADTPHGLALCARLLGTLDATDSESVARAVSMMEGSLVAPGPAHIELECCVGSLSRGVWSRRRREAAESMGDTLDRRCIDPALAFSIVQQAADRRPDVAVTLAGIGDPLMHASLPELAASVRGAGAAAVHLRTDLLSTRYSEDDLLAMGFDAISVDVQAATPHGYETLHGADRFDEIVDRVESLARARAGFSGDAIPGPWIAPRIARCEESRDELEMFYAAWIQSTGAAVIDPPVTGVGASGRGGMDLLPLPALGKRLGETRRLVVRSDGTAVSPAGVMLGDLNEETLTTVWRQRERRAEVAVSRSRRPEPAA